VVSNLGVVYQTSMVAVDCGSSIKDIERRNRWSIKGGGGEIDVQEGRYQSQRNSLRNPIVPD
jgi:hypothetical protein